MKQRKKMLVKEYNMHMKVAEEEKDKALEVKRILASLAPHKVGEIIEWVEAAKQKNIGTYHYPNMVALPEKKNRAVLVSVEVLVFKEKCEYCYRFSPIKKNGEKANTRCYPYNYKWTGEIMEFEKML